MNQTHSAAERRTVAQIAKEIEDARISASAELAFSALPDKPDNPWQGSVQRLEALQNEHASAVALARAEQLAAVLDQLHRLDVDLARLTEERKAAQQAVAGASEDETVQRWLNAKSVAIQHGVAHALEIVTPWLLSDKGRFAAPVQLSAMSHPSWPVELRFDSDEDRQKLRQFEALRDKANRSGAQWCATNDKRRQLVAEFPELKSASPRH